MPDSEMHALANDSLTLGMFLVEILPRLKENNNPPVWPPDMFGVCTAVLLRSGAYCRALTDWPPENFGAETWEQHVEEVASAWRKSWAQQQVPKAVSLSWERIQGFRNVPLMEVQKNIPLCQTLLELSAFSDEACENAGVPLEGPTDYPEFYNHIDKVLYPTDMGSSLCEEIRQDRLRVLPKMRTPQNGLTVRSLSIHLALLTVSEVVPKWFTTPSYSSDGVSLNLLIVPWPKTIYPSQFNEVQGLSGEMRNMPEDFGFFTFSQKEETPKVEHVVRSLYESASLKLGRIDGIVLPELSVSEKEHTNLAEYALSKAAFLLSGVGKASQLNGQCGENTVCLDIPGVEPLRQAKHHRWKLDGAQIQQYGLGSRLHPERQWWEHVSLLDRQLMFVSMFPWLVMCPLICEDLARPDPIGDVVRAVGPNLVIAILMDGPQVKERWGARYATSLADDPGCSVLTVTSLGMAGLSRPLRGGIPRSNVVALWKDSDHGAPIEIELPPGCDGVVLSLTARYLQEWTADGRCDQGAAGCPVLSGVHTVQFASN